MTQQERNKQIALMLGFEWNDECKTYYRNKKDSEWGTDTENLKFHSDWNLLMEAVEFIESPIDKLPNGIFVKINTGGCFIHHINDTKNYIAKVYQAGKTKKETIFIAVSDFAKLYNENNL